MLVKKLSLSSIVLLLSLLVLAIVVGNIFLKNSQQSVPQNLVGVLNPQAKLITDFALTDQHGDVFDTKRLHGKWSFVFFGYTFCPDICPTTLAVLTAMQKHLKNAPEAWSDAQVVFVSVDPARDTQEKLAAYMEFFNKEFIALTGSKEQIDNLAHQYNAGYIIEPETSPGHYLISHSGAIFLTDPGGDFVGSFSMPHNPGTIASLFREIRDVL